MYNGHSILKNGRKGHPVVHSLQAGQFQLRGMAEVSCKKMMEKFSLKYFECNADLNPDGVLTKPEFVGCSHVRGRNMAHQIKIWTR